MAMDDRTPVLVGVGAVSDPGATSAIELLWTAVEQAFADSGRPALAARTGLVAIPNGTWLDSNPGGEIARRLGARAKTLVAEIGITQQALLSRACAAIAAGAVDVVVVAGVELKHSERLGTAVAPTIDGAPDEMWRPAGEILTRTEIERELAVPAHEYALIERTLGDTDPATLWAAFAAVATENPDAWDRSAPSAADIASARMIAEPYTRLLCSQWNVNQSAAVVLASMVTARSAGVAHDRWVFPIGAAGSDLMLPLPLRDDVARWPAFECCIGALPVGIDDVTYIDLYSCFPSAVQVQARALGLALDDARGLTVTGGMTFAGGPLNSYVLHALVTLARRLRADPGAIGLSTSVSGMLTKPGVGLWSGEPPAGPFVAHDVTDAARAATAARPLEPDATGAATIVTATRLHDREGPRATVALLDLPTGARTVATSTPDSMIDAGVEVLVTAPGAYVGA
jgi:acetyl-CoA C-acetyltransferase